MRTVNHGTMGCGHCVLNRRQFLAGCAACAAGAGSLTALSSRSYAAETTAKPRIRLVFTYRPSDRPIWPNIGYDFDKRKKTLLEQITKACPEIEFLPATVNTAEAAEKLVAESGDVDGYFVWLLGLWTQAPQVIGATGKPTIFADDLYGGSGEFLIANAAARRAGHKVVGVSSSRFEDVVAAVACFTLLKKPGATVDDFLAGATAAWKKGVQRSGDLTYKPDDVRTIDTAECCKRLKASTILVVGRNAKPLIEATENVVGTKVLPIEFSELDAAYQSADRDEAAEWADRWIKTAAKVIEPSRDEIVKSAAMYLAEREVLKKHNAQAIAIHCLGGFYGGHIHAYPCLGFTQLNNDGLVGACEADLMSTVTMLAGSTLSGRPGYISDPVLDTSKNRIIYAHCVAPTKVFGPDGDANPYHIRDHSEDRQGAAVRSLLPLGHMTTTLKLHPIRKEIILHQGKSVENVDEDMACRTKLAVEVKGDIDKLMNEWDQWSWHRVTFFGDLKAPFEALAEALGMKMVYEA
ncbi:MAG: hypothetical protein JXA69_13635 [Phycisphaerae bacterium]|nr:hypothetical protein [Phycisphaerae bacterium]